MSQTTIEWTATPLPDGTMLPGYTFSPWGGCQAVSEACAFCYAEANDRRFPRTRGAWGPHGVRIPRAESAWEQVFRWDRAAGRAGIQRKVFPSMCDPFDNHRTIQSAWRDRHWDMIRRTSNLIHLLLTKRPQNIPQYLPPDWGDGYRNVWLGTTTENQVEADRRIHHLLRVPAVVRFLSVEPLLGPVDLRNLNIGNGVALDALTGYHSCSIQIDGFSSAQGALASIPILPVPTGYISWVIVGGESGPQARPMHPAWAMDLKDQCDRMNCPFFFKQWGTYGPQPDKIAGGLFRQVSKKTVHILPGGFVLERQGKHASGAVLDGAEHKAFPVTECEMVTE